jgi:hypothetical protein
MPRIYLILIVVLFLSGCGNPSGWRERDATTGIGTKIFAGEYKEEPFAIYRGGFKGENYHGNGRFIFPNYVHGDGYQLDWTQNSVWQVQFNDGAMVDKSASVYTHGPWGKECSGNKLPNKCNRSFQISGDLNFYPSPGNNIWWGKYGFHGAGTVVFASGLKYTGEISNFPRPTLAYYHRSSNDRLTVTYDHNRLFGTKIKGKGILYFPDGRIFEGLFSDWILIKSSSFNEREPEHMDYVEGKKIYFYPTELMAFGVIKFPDGTSREGILTGSYEDYLNTSFKEAKISEATVEFRKNEDYINKVLAHSYSRMRETQAFIDERIAENERSRVASEKILQDQYIQNRNKLNADLHQYSRSVDQANTSIQENRRIQNQANDQRKELYSANKQTNNSADVSSNPKIIQEVSNSKNNLNQSSGNLANNNDKGTSSKPRATTDAIVLKQDTNLPKSAAPAKEILPKLVGYNLEATETKPTKEDACTWARSSAQAGNVYVDDESLRKYGGVPISTIGPCECSRKDTKLANYVSQSFTCTVKYVRWSDKPLEIRPKVPYTGGTVTR